MLLRPRTTLAYILFRLEIELDYVFGSKWLINELNRLGFSSSVDGVTWFKQSVVVNDDCSKIDPMEVLAMEYYSIHCN